MTLTVGSSFVDLGGFNVALNLASAAAKRHAVHASDGMLPRLAVAAAGLWLVILFGLTLIGR
ncbi:hypothetical protein [Mesorhizobium argentiipisi]|uniref:Uncharacterized protein n=1 Tax=Mesorhizobium argentiipisi TaxID=3015175 RepID=A0ABU8K5E4_9HYPH